MAASSSGCHQTVSLLCSAARLLGGSAHEGLAGMLARNFSTTPPPNMYVPPPTCVVLFLGFCTARGGGKQGREEHRKDHMRGVTKKVRGGDDTCISWKAYLSPAEIFS